MLDYADTIKPEVMGTYRRMRRSYLKTTFEKHREFLGFPTDEGADESDITNSIMCFHAACFPSHGRRFAVTKKGRFCLVRKDNQSGNLICVLRSSQVRYIFRPHTEDHGPMNFREILIHGIMHRQMSDSKECKVREFFLD